MGRVTGNSEVGVFARQSRWPPERFNAVPSVNWIFEMTKPLRFDYLPVNFSYEFGLSDFENN